MISDDHDSTSPENQLDNLVNVQKYPLKNHDDISILKKKLAQNGVVTLSDFILKSALDELVTEAQDQSHNAYFASSTHNVYLTPLDNTLPSNHIHNRQMNSSKGCITTDQIPSESVLHKIYHNRAFQRYLASILDVEALYPYEDPLSSINVHYYTKEGQELGWHFDNSSFAITLLLQSPEEGGVFEYVPNLRDSSSGEMNYEGVSRVVGGTTDIKVLDIQPGTLVLFRGRDSLHRVTPTFGKRTRILVVLAYNDKPGVSLSEEARLTFFGRTGL